MERDSSEGELLTLNVSHVFGMSHRSLTIVAPWFLRLPTSESCFYATS
jgi:hypothetical protein